MKLYILRPNKRLRSRSPWKPWYDKSFGFVVRVESESKAREIASQKSGDEGEKPWLNEKLSTCLELSADGEAELIIQDFASA